MIYHVTPIGDIKAHIESEVCECNPSVQTIEGDIVCVHNSFGRVEELKEHKKTEASLDGSVKYEITIGVPLPISIQ